MKHALSAATYLAAALLGVLAYLYPFLVPLGRVSAEASNAWQQNAAPIISTGLVALCLAALLFEAQSQVISTKVIALLGVLIATAATLRWIEVAIPGPAGFSPIFAPIILVGYVFGARLGFLMGALTLFASALITGGVGPWLPYQMFAAGWLGLGAGFLPHGRSGKATIPTLVAYGIAAGIFYGVMTNLYFWPLVTGDSATGYEPGLTLGQIVRRYAAFYAASSLIWDVFRSAGNAGLLLILGMPAVRALLRFRQRFVFTTHQRVAP